MAGFRRALDKAAFETEQLKTPARDARRGACQIDRSVAGPRARKKFGLAAAPAGDFEHAQARVLSKPTVDCGRQCTLYRCWSRLR